MFHADTGTWHIRYPDGAVHSFAFGSPGDTPLLGDWNCDGRETVGVHSRSSGLARLRDANTAGAIDHEFFFGIPGDLAVVGDWDGDGCDTLAIYRPSESQFYVAGGLGTAFADDGFFFGVREDKPFAGDFDGDGIDGIGVYRPSNGSVFIRDELSTGVANTQFPYGILGDRIFFGDWDDNGIDTAAAFRSSEGRVYVSAANQFGASVTEASFGEPGWVPVSGTDVEEPTEELDFGTVPPSSTTSTTGPADDPTTTTAPTTTTTTATPPATTTTTTPPTATTTTTAPTTTTTLPPTTTTTAPPPSTTSTTVLPPSPPSDESYGPALKGRYLRPAAPKNLDWALGPWEAPRSGELEALSLYFIFANSNYFGGSGGVNRFTVRTDSGGQPSSTVLGQFTISNPTASNGVWADWASERASWDPFSFENPVAVVEGQKYWIVGENLHSDPIGNWVGINSISSGDGPPGTSFIHRETAPGSNTFEKFNYPNEGSFLGVFDLTYRQGDGFGQGLIHSYFDQTIGGTARAREVFTPSATQAVSDVRLWATRTSGTGALTATLKENGSTVTQATAGGTGWMTFPMDLVLRAGTTYELEFTAPAGTGFQLTALRENGAWSAGSRFVDGYADYDPGSGWSGGWPIWDHTRQDADLQFYFSLS